LFLLFLFEVCPDTSSFVIGVLRVSTKFWGKGNLGKDPVLKSVKKDGEDRSVCEMRIMFDRMVPDGDNGFINKGGFWMNVNAWGSLGESCARMLRKGMRVKVEGSQVQHDWKDGETGQDKSRIELVADDVTLDLRWIETVVLSPRDK
jgi:single-strand DNA-binding protein